MTELTDHKHRPSPSQDDAVLAAAAAAATGNNGTMQSSTGGDANRGVKRPRPTAIPDDDDDDEDKPGRERRKIEIKFIQDKSRRHITFSKRKAGIMKKVCLRSLDRARRILATLSSSMAFADLDHIRLMNYLSSRVPKFSC